jgi:hypothetical protein
MSQSQLAPVHTESDVLAEIQRDRRICAISVDHFKRIQVYLSKNPSVIQHYLGQGHSPGYAARQIERAC